MVRAAAISFCIASVSGCVLVPNSLANKLRGNNDPALPNYADELFPDFPSTGALPADAQSFNQSPATRNDDSQTLTKPVTS